MSLGLPMIDWLKANLPLSEPLGLEHARLIRLGPGGEVEWEARSWSSVEGSGDASVRLRESPGLLEFSGNPAKFLRGHNLAGSSDLVPVAVAAVLRALDRLGARPEHADLLRWREGRFDLKLVHVNAYLDLGTDERALEYLRWLEGASVSRRWARGMLRGSTVSWTSRALRLKVYHKLQEVLDRRLLHHLREKCASRVVGWLTGKLRFEIELRSRELKRLGLQKGELWNGLDLRRLVLHYAEAVELPKAPPVSASSLQVPRHLRATVLLWREGVDLRTALPRRTFYRHRRELLEYGIDITRPPTPEERLEPVKTPPFPSLAEVLSFDVPDWLEGCEVA